MSMPVVKNKNTEKNREFWSHVENISREADRLLQRQENGCENGTIRQRNANGEIVSRRNPDEPDHCE
jgi:hypothetical protein